MRLDENICNSNKTGKLEKSSKKLFSKFSLPLTLLRGDGGEAENEVVGFVGVGWVLVSYEDEQNQNNCRQI